MRYETVQQITGPDPEPMYIVVVKVPIRAGEEVLDELSAVVGEAVHDFKRTIPDRAWETSVTGYYPPGHLPPDVADR